MIYGDEIYWRFISQFQTHLLKAIGKQTISECHLFAIFLFIFFHRPFEDPDFRIAHERGFITVLKTVIKASQHPDHAIRSTCKLPYLYNYILSLRRREELCWMSLKPLTMERISIAWQQYLIAEMLTIPVQVSDPRAAGGLPARYWGETGRDPEWIYCLWMIVRITLHPPTHHPPTHRPPTRHPPTRQPPIGSTVGSTSISHFLFRNLYPSYVWDAASSHLHPIIILFFYRLFRKVYAISNRMYLFLPIDRFLRTRSRNLLMYLDPLVSLRFSSFELVILLHIYHILFRSCRTNLVSRSQVTLLTMIYNEIATLFICFQRVYRRDLFSTHNDDEIEQAVRSIGSIKRKVKEIFELPSVRKLLHFLQDQQTRGVDPRTHTQGLRCYVFYTLFQTWSLLTIANYLLFDQLEHDLPQTVQQVIWDMPIYREETTFTNPLNVRHTRPQNSMCAALGLLLTPLLIPNQESRAFPYTRN